MFLALWLLSIIEATEQNQIHNLFQAKGTLCILYMRLQYNTQRDSIIHSQVGAHSQIFYHVFRSGHLCTQRPGSQWTLAGWQKSSTLITTPFQLEGCLWCSPWQATKVLEGAPEAATAWCKAPSCPPSWHSQGITEQFLQSPEANNSNQNCSSLLQCRPSQRRLGGCRG